MSRERRVAAGVVDRPEASRQVASARIGAAARGGAALGVRVVTALGQVFITLALTNTSSIGDFGIYGSAFAFGVVVTALVNLGIPQWLLRVDSEDRADLVPSLLRTGALGGLAAGVAALAMASLSSGFSAIALAAGAAVTGEALSLLAQNLWFGRLRPQLAVGIQFAARMFPLLAVGGAVVSGAPVYAALAIGYAASGAFLLVALRELFRGPWSWRESATGGLPYWRASTWAMLQQLDVPIVSVLIGRADAGAYSAAFRIASPVHIVTALLNSMYVPILSREEAGVGRWVAGRRLVSWGGLYALAVALAAPIVAWLAPMLVGDQYAPYRLVFAILVINSAISVVNQLLIAWLYADALAPAVAKANRNSTVVGLLVIAALAFATRDVVWAAVGCVSIQVTLMAQLVAVRRRNR